VITSIYNLGPFPPSTLVAVVLHSAPIRVYQPVQPNPQSLTTYTGDTHIAAHPTKSIKMPSSSMCPCDACFNSPYPTQQSIQARTEAQRKSYVVHIPTHLPSFLSSRKLKLSRTASIASTTSSMVGLRGAAQPMATTD
jgi:hypothetical protein